MAVHEIDEISIFCKYDCVLFSSLFKISLSVAVSNPSRWADDASQPIS